MTADELLAGLPAKHHNVAYVDPPWAYAVRSPKGEGRSASQHYDTMSLDALMALPVADVMARDCTLLCWAIDPMLPHALRLIERWGFTYKTVGLYWVKTNRDGTPFTGMGFWTRANPEQCLLATRGRPKRMAKDVKRLIISPRREHSRKPEEAYERIERLVQGPYLELFGRAERPGWTVRGNQVGKFNVSNDFVGDKASAA